MLKEKEGREEMSFENLSLIQNPIESELLKMESTYGGYPNPYSQIGQPEQVAQHHTQSGSEYLQAWRYCNVPGQPVPEFDQPHCEKGFFLMLKWNFPSFSWYPLSCSEIPLERVCLLYSLCQEFIHIGKIP